MVVRPSKTYLIAKRFIDLFIAGAAAIALSPLGVILYCMVRVTSPGPALYRSRRVGRHEQPFTMFKFRTMTQDAETSGGWQTVNNDPRVTKLGRALRQSSLDEIPQLVNVLRGDMSLVGPRPASFEQLRLYTSSQRLRRASLRPGLTGLAQVKGRSALPVERAIRYDCAYAKLVSIALDCRIICETLPQVVRRQGTN